MEANEVQVLMESCRDQDPGNQPKFENTVPQMAALESIPRDADVSQFFARVVRHGDHAGGGHEAAD
jgi:hypothetical protein